MKLHPGGQIVGFCLFVDSVTLDLECTQLMQEGKNAKLRN